MSDLRIAVVCLGTRGDVEPYVALAQGLKKAGFPVTLAAGEDFADFVRERDVDFWPLGATFRSLVESKEGRAALAGSPQAALTTLKPMIARARKDVEELVTHVDAVVFHPVLTFVEELARKQSIPAIRAVASVPVMVQGPAVYGYSPHVLPPSPEWPDDIVMTGYWRVTGTSTFEPPASLQSFLDDGEPPVYVGFGSMTSLDASELSELVSDALEIASARGVLATGWGGLETKEKSGHLFVVSEVVHDWLFPRVSAVVHHGGAGTTGAGLRAGRPTVVCPFGLDQPFWGQVVQKLGVGPAAIPQKELTAELLGAAIREAVFREDFRVRARELGEKISRENGVRDAVLFIGDVIRRDDA